MEIEMVADEYIDPLYKIIKALEKRGSTPIDTGWLEFIEKTYGCMQDNPIKRGTQDVFDIREIIR